MEGDMEVSCFPPALTSVHFDWKVRAFSNLFSAAGARWNDGEGSDSRAFCG